MRWLVIFSKVCWPAPVAFKVGCLLAMPSKPNDSLKHLSNPALQALHIHVREGKLHVIGVDEAGRGPLCGPVVAGAVLLGQGHGIEGLACSKTLSPSQRDRLLRDISSRANSWGLGAASPQEIDQLNILQASLLAMRRAVDTLIQKANIDPNKCIIAVDGNRLPRWGYQAIAIVKGDALVEEISAASIIAKVNRDSWCKQMAQRYPLLELDQHMGYPTPRHLALIEQHGVVPSIYRHSFRPVAAALEQQQKELF